MIDKEVAELRKRFRSDRSNISKVCGCYVTAQREIRWRFEQSLGLMAEEEGEELLKTLRKTLSGKIDQHLIDLRFETKEVNQSEQHKLLMALRDTALNNEETLEQFYEIVSQSFAYGEDYLILLAYDAYDVPYRGKDGEIMRDNASQVFSYILCSICPVKQTKPSLSFYTAEKPFKAMDISRLITAPAVGFLFPAFDDRCTNLYNALYYSKDLKSIHEELIDAVFGIEPPMAAGVQKESFECLLSDSLQEELSLPVVQAVSDTLGAMIEARKVDEDAYSPTVSKEAIGRVLIDSGVSQERVEEFEQRYEEVFGEQTELNPQNLYSGKYIELTCNDVIVKVRADRSDLVETRMIDGRQYLLVRIEEGLSVNGIEVAPAKEEIIASLAAAETES